MPILKAALRYAVYLVGFSIILFWIFSRLPGNAADFLLGIEADEKTKLILQQQLGLDLPFFERYFRWVSQFILGNWGISYITQSPVIELIGNKILISFFLTLYAISLAILISFPIAMMMSLKEKKVTGQFLQILVSIALSIPSFWLGLMLIILFVFLWPLFPASANILSEDTFLIMVSKMFLPSLALAIPQSAALAKVLYASLEATKSQNYVLVAKAKGLTNKKILYHHQLVNALGPTIANLGVQFSLLFVGAIIIENLFLIPGIGRELLASVQQRDMPVIMAILIILLLITVVVQFLCTTINSYLDRRPENH